MSVFKVQRKYRFLRGFQSLKKIQVSKTPVGPGVKHFLFQRSTLNHPPSAGNLSVLTHHLFKPSEVCLLLLQIMMDIHHHSSVKF